MPRYFLHLRDGTEEVIDSEGTELPNMEALRRFVLRSARGLISEDVRNGVVDLRFRIDAETEAGQLVYTLPFKHAFSIIPEDGPAPGGE